MQKNESPVAAVERVLRHHHFEPSSLLVMMLIDAVRETTPVPQEMSIGLLKKLLQGLAPENALEGWAHRSAREITLLISKHATMKVVHANDEQLWCALEGVIGAMLIRVTRGQDLAP